MKIKKYGTMPYILLRGILCVFGFVRCAASRTMKKRAYLQKAFPLEHHGMTFLLIGAALIVA
jgi:hypothetical protein